MKQLQRLSLLFLFLLPTLPSFAQQHAEALGNYFEKARQDWNIPGMAIGVIKDGEVLLAKGFGRLEEGKSEMTDANTLFAIASNTKAFVSAAIGILVDEGKLSWDDPVQKYLPEFTLYDEYVSNHITVRDLLCHRAGLGTFSGDVIWYKRDLTPEELIRNHIPHVPQAYEFRAGYGYSNLMFITAGEVIRAVSGKPWNEFVKERIFIPLEMNRTVTSVTDLKKLGNYATPHKNSRSENKPIPYVNWDNMGAAGGILSSVNDMLNWIQLQLNEGIQGTDTLFSPQVQSDFWQPHNSFKVSKSARKTYGKRNFSAYGLGWSIYDYHGRTVYSHGGGYDGMYSKVAIVPEENIGFVILTNNMTGILNPMLFHTLDELLGTGEKDFDWSEWGLDREKRWNAYKENRIQERIDKRVKETSPSLPPEEYAGLYRCQMFGDIEVKFRNGQLELHFSDGPLLEATLSHWHYDTFEISWKNTHAWFDFGTVQFLFDNNRNIVELKFDVPNDDIFYHEIKAEKVKGEG